MDTFAQMILSPMAPHHPYDSAFLSSHLRMRSHEYFNFFLSFGFYQHLSSFPRSLTSFLICTNLLCLHRLEFCWLLEIYFLYLLNVFNGNQMNSETLFTAVIFSNKMRMVTCICVDVLFFESYILRIFFFQISGVISPQPQEMLPMMLALKPTW